MWSSEINEAISRPHNVDFIQKTHDLRADFVHCTRPLGTVSTWNQNGWWAMTVIKERHLSTLTYDRLL